MNELERSERTTNCNWRDNVDVAADTIMIVKPELEPILKSYNTTKSVFWNTKREFLIQYVHVHVYICMYYLWTFIMC